MRTAGWLMAEATVTAAIRITVYGGYPYYGGYYGYGPTVGIGLGYGGWWGGGYGYGGHRTVVHRHVHRGHHRR